MSDRVRRYQEAGAALDFDALGELRHPDYECYYPQSGERFLGHENWVLAHKDYVTRFSQAQLLDAHVKGGERKAEVARGASMTFFMSPPVIQVSGSGDLAVLEGEGTWPDGKVYNWVMILEYKDGLVWRETEYFAEPFEAPEWRAPFTEAADI